MQPDQRRRRAVFALTALFALLIVLIFLGVVVSFLGGFSELFRIQPVPYPAI